MSIKDATLDLGGLKVSVGLDVSGLDRDLAALNRRLDEYARSAALRIPMGGVSGGGSGFSVYQNSSAAYSSTSAAVIGGSGSGGSTASAASSTAVVNQSFVMISSVASELQGVFKSLAKQLGTAAHDMTRAIDAVVDRLQDVAKSSKQTASVLRGNQLAYNDYFRAEAGQLAGERAKKAWRRAIYGEKGSITGPPGALSGLPADVRAIAGIGFDEPRRYVPHAVAPPAAARPAVVPDAPIPPSTWRPRALPAEMQRRLNEMQRRLQQKSTRSPALPAQAYDWMLTPEQLAAAKVTLNIKVGEPEPIKRSAKTEEDSGGGRRGRRRDGTIDHRTMMGLARGGLGAVGGYGVAKLAGAAGLATLAGPHGLALAGGASLVGGLAAMNPEKTKRVLAGLNAGLHGFMYSVNKAGSGLRAFSRGLGRIEIATRGLRTVLGGLVHVMTFPFRVGVRFIGLWDHRANLATNSLRLMKITASGLGQALSRPFRVALSPVTTFTKAVTGSVSNIFKYISGLGPALAAIAPSLAVAGLGKAVMMAANFNETLNKVRATFGGAAAGIEDFAERAGNKLGMVKQLTLDTASTFGLLLKGQGLGNEQAAGVSEKLTKLAADMSSFFNVSMEESARSISSALRGQFEPISKFGVVIKKEDIKNLAEMRGEATRAGEAMATYDLIVRGLVPAQGDLEKTMFSTTNLLRALRGMFVNYATEIGRRFEPALREVLLLFRDLFSMDPGGAQGFLLNFFERIGESLQRNIHFVRLMLANIPKATALMHELLVVGRNNIGEILQWIGKVMIEVFDQIAAPISNAIVKAFELAWPRITGWIGRVIDLWNHPEKAGGAALAGGLDGKGLFAQREQIQNFKFGDLPSIDLSMSDETKKKIEDLVRGITGTVLPGDGQAAPGGMGAAMMNPEGLAGLDAGGADSGKVSARLGQLIGAAQLADMQQQSVFERKSLDAQERTAEGISEIRDFIRKGGLSPGVAVLA